MNRPLSRGLALTLGALSLVLSAPARAQEAEPSSGPAPVRIDFPGGKPLHFTQTMREDLLSDVGMIPMDRSILLRRDVALTPVERTADGGWKVTWTIHRIRGRIVSTVFDGAFDSAGKRDAEANLLLDPLLALAGASFDVEIGPHGAIRSVGGLDKALDGAVAHVAEDERAFLRMMMARIQTPDRVRSELAELLPYAPLPDAVAAPGATWSVAGSIPFESGIDFHTKSEVSLTGAEGTSLRWSAAGEGSATFAKGRTSSWGEMLADDRPDRFDVGHGGTFDAADGLPVAQSGWFWADAMADTDDGGTSRFLVRRRMVVERVPERTIDAIRAGGPTDGLESFELVPEEHPYRFAATLQWLGIRARLDAKSGELDAAGRRFEEALQLAEALASGKQTTAETDAVRGGWERRTVSILHDWASTQYDHEAWLPAAKTWERLLALPAVRAGVNAGDGWMSWEAARAGVMRAQALSAAGEQDAASAQIESSSAVLAAARSKVPDDHELTDLLAWLFERWAVLRQDADDRAGALARALEGLAVRDALDAKLPPEKRSPERRVDQLWDVADYAVLADQPEKAAELLARAAALVAPLAKDDEGYAGYAAEIATRRDACKAIASGEKPASPAQAVEMAYLLHSMKRYADASAAFAVAFADESIRLDWDRHNLYNAACSAALAHAAAEGDTKALLAKTALSWLKPHVERLRGLAASDDEEQAEFARGYLNHVRERDPDMASLRGLPEFTKLFE